MEKEQLKRCPFCGGMAEVDMGTDGARIRCSVCGVSTEYYKDTSPSFEKGGMGDSRDYRMVKSGTYGINEAFEIWNRRL